MITKWTFLILFACCLNNSLVGQQDVASATLVSNSINRAHPFYEVLLKKDTEYLSWLYFHCKGLSDKSSLKTPLNKPLIFSIKQDGATVEDTVSNCVYPKIYEDEREPEWKSELPLYGSFPKYVNFHLSNDPKIAAVIDLSINRACIIKMYVLTEEGDLVETISDTPLQKGSHQFRWNTSAIKSGNYLLFTEIEGYLTIHSIAIEKHWWTNLFSRNKEVTRTKKVIQFRFEGDIQMPEREGHYIHNNRNGTSIGVNLLAAAMVNIKLHTINGVFITTLNSKQLNTGESQFLLNKHIDKTGWYLIQLSINDKVKHIKLKIKK